MTATLPTKAPPTEPTEGVDSPAPALPRLPDTDEAALRSHACGLPPLTARLEPWMVEALADGPALNALVPDDAPVNLHDTSAFARNVHELQDAAGEHGVSLDVFFARKTDKCVAYVDVACDEGFGLDVAGTNELSQTLEAGVHPSRIIVTAAVKTRSLVARAVEAGVTLSLDNADEVDRVRIEAERQGRTASVALRLARFRHEGQVLPSRFGFDVGDCLAVAGGLVDSPLTLEGLHFHLDGYDAPQRASAMDACLDLYAGLRSQGHPATFLDIGGGVPMSYLDSAEQWTTFWAAVDDDPHAVTVDGTRYRRGDGRSLYPYHQSPTRGAWLGGLLATNHNGRTIASRLKELNVDLRCEPGRSVMDGCGMTVARVEFRRDCPPSVNAREGTLVGLAMNRTQCRTTSEDFLVDPILVPQGVGGRSDACEGYLVGAYCMESEFLTKRRLRFDRGVAVGDLVAFPNTAGYMMHFMESRSHQFPLAPNLVRTSAGWHEDGPSW